MSQLRMFEQQPVIPSAVRSPVNLMNMEARELVQQLAIASRHGRGRAGRSYKRRVLAEFKRRGIAPS